MGVNVGVRVNLGVVNVGVKDGVRLLKRVKDGVGLVQLFFVSSC
jgi:hypothetical protein